MDSFNFSVFFANYEFFSILLIQSEGDFASRRPSMKKMLYNRPYSFWLFLIASGLVVQMFHHSLLSNYLASFSPVYFQNHFIE
jgi:hypothetical protein